MKFIPVGCSKSSRMLDYVCMRFCGTVFMVRRRVAGRYSVHRPRRRASTYGPIDRGVWLSVGVWSACRDGREDGCWSWEAAGTYGYVSVEGFRERAVLWDPSSYNMITPEQSPTPKALTLNQIFCFTSIFGC